MPLNILSIAQLFCRRQGLPQPTFLVSNANAQASQILGLLEEFCDDLVSRGLWEQTTREAVFTSVAAESQGLIAALAPYGFRGIVPNTFFDRTQRLEVPVAISSQEWQVRKALNISGPLYQARIRQGELLFIPAPPAGHQMAFEYRSDYFVSSTDLVNAVEYVKYPTKDSDFFLVDDSLPIAYLRWAWKSQKGQDYTEEFRKYEILVAQEQSSKRAARPVNLGHNQVDARPGILVPPGSWPVSN